MKIRLLFSANHMPFSWLIRTLTFSKWSHVDLVTDRGTLIGATIPAGVVEYSVLHRINGSSKYEYRDIECDERIYDFVRKQLGKRYDYAGIAGLELNRNWTDDDAWFCSELIGAGALNAGNTEIKEELFRLTPGMLYKYSTSV